MNEVAKVETSAEVERAGSLLEVIARAARDPNVDIDKMERLLEMQERVIAREARAAYSVALAELQPNLPVISERGKILNGKGDTQSTYALWEDVNQAIRPLLAETGFSLSFRTGRADDGQITVTGVLAHKEGHSEETTITLPSDGSGSKNAVQAVASSTSYGKRYTAFALLNITSRGEDDDGGSATYKDAKGEPLARTKLEGPHSSKSALKTAVHNLIAEVRKAQSEAEIDDLLKLAKPTLAQARRDWLSLIEGDPQVPEDNGLKGAVEAQRALVNADSGVNVAIDSMKDQCKTRYDLEGWMDRNAAVLETFDGADSRRFQAAYDEFESGLLAVDRLRAG